jgi:hypothetical protein
MALPTILHKAGMHPEYSGPTTELPGKRALIITTSHAILNAQGETTEAATGVTDRPLEQLGIAMTPLHPETELRKAGLFYESSSALIDIFATHVAIDDEQRFVTGKNQNSGLETSHAMMTIFGNRQESAE